MKESRFTGKMLGYLGINILSFLITSFTLGLGYPWAVVNKQRWLTKHQTIDGQQLTFDGTGSQLFGNYIKWFLLTLITFGIYGLWLPLKIQNWVTMHTHIKDPNLRSNAHDPKEVGYASQVEFGKRMKSFSKELTVARISWVVAIVLSLFAYRRSIILVLRRLPQVFVYGFSAIPYIALIDAFVGILLAIFLISLLFGKVKKKWRTSVTVIHITLYLVTVINVFFFVFLSPQHRFYPIEVFLTLRLVSLIALLIGNVMYQKHVGKQLKPMSIEEKG